MNREERRPWRGLPVSELTFAIALIVAVVSLLSPDSPRGTWAASGAIALALLAGAELRWRNRGHNEHSTSPMTASGDVTASTQAAASPAGAQSARAGEHDRQGES
jgi:hypothetical protein